MMQYLVRQVFYLKDLALEHTPLLTTMNTLQQLIPILGLALIAHACGGQKEMTNAVEPNHFVFGSGGGFTGKYAEFKLHNDGTIEQMNFDTEAYEPYAKVAPNEVLPFFIDLEKLALQELKFNHPGNMTWYIEVHDGASVNRVKWGDHNAPVRPDIQAFFKKVNDFAVSLKP